MISCLVLNLIKNVEMDDGVLQRMSMVFSR